MQELNRPEIVCLCGSTRFKEEFIAENRRLTLEGKIVLTVGVFGHDENEQPMDEETKRQLDNLHLRKIDLADSVLVITVDGYIGKSTAVEILYALDATKPVHYSHYSQKYFSAL